MVTGLVFRKKIALTLFALAVMGNFAFWLFLNQVNAAVPKIISYQGRLTNSSGDLLGGSGTSYYFRFAIFSAESEGTQLWPGSTPATITSSVANGVFNINIGDSSNTCDPSCDSLTLDFNDSQNYYLEVRVASASNFSDGETLTPRQRVVSSGYAINADTVDGAHASTSTGASTIPITDISGIINLTASTAGISATSTNALTIQGNGTGDIRFFSTSNALSSAGNLTIAGNATINGSGTSTIASGLSVGILNISSVTATSTFANGIQINAGCFRMPDGTCAGAGSSGANTALSNLASVAINTSLLSDTNNTDDLGSYALSWRNIYASGTLTVSGATSTILNGLNLGALNVTSSSVTSTFANGIQISAGCYRVPNGNCLTTASVGEGWTDAGNFIRLTANTDIVTIGQDTILAGGPQLGVVATSSTAIPLIVQGAASQSAHLTRWQNSSESALAWIDSSGGVSAASGTITGVLTVSGSGTSTVIVNNVNIGGSLNVAGGATSTFGNGIQLNGGCFRDPSGNCIVAGANTALSNLSGVAINTSLLSDTNNTDDLGSYALSWRNIYASGTVFAKGFSTSTLDNVVIGGSTRAAGNFTAFDFNGVGTIGDGGDAITLNSNTWDIGSAGTATGLSLSTSTLDNVVIGGTTRAAGSFTTLDFNGVGTIGDGGDAIAVNSNTWDISGAGTATGLSLSTSTLDSITIGGTTASAGTFTTLNASSTSYLSHLVPSINNAYDLGSPSSSWRNINASGTLFVGSTGTSTISGGLSASVLNITSNSVTSTFANGIQLNGGCFRDISGNCIVAGANTALSNLASVAINTSLLSDTNNTDDLGSYALSWRNIYASGTVFAKGFSTSTLDNVIIGGSTRAAGNFTAFDFNGVGTIGDGGDAITVNSNTWDISSAGVATSLSLSTSTLDSVTIGGTTGAAGTFTTLNASSTSYLSHLVPSINNAYDLGSPSSSWRNINASGTLFIAGSGTSTISGGLQASVLNIISSSVTSTFANGIQLNGGCFRDISGNCIVAGANTALSNLASVAINTSLLSDTNNTDDLGSYALSWRNIYASGTVFAKGFSTSTLDNVVIGGSTRAAGNFTTFDFNGAGILGDGGDDIAINSNDWDISSAGAATGLSLSTSTLDNVVIGGTTRAAGNFTTFDFNGAGVLGDGGDDIAINSNDWDISSAGTATGLSLSTSTIDNVIIGGTTAVAGTFTTLNASSTSYLSHLVPSINNAYDLGSPSSSWRNINASGTLFIAGSGTSTISGGLQASVLNIISSSVTSTFANGIQLNGGCFRDISGNCIVAGANTALSNLSGVAINTSLLSDTNNTDDLGSYALSWRNIYASGTVFAKGFSTSTLDNVVIGGSTRAAGNFTAFDFNGVGTIGDGGDAITVNSNTWDISSAGTATSLSLSTSTIDNMVIGGTTAAAGTFTTLNASSTSYLSHLVPSINNAYDLGSPSSSWRNINASGTLFVGSTGTSTFSGGLQASVLNVTSNSATSTFGNGIQLNNGCFRDVVGNCLTVAGGSANTALSNLASVAINTSLLSDTNNTDDLGSYALSWKNIYASGTIFAAGFSTSTLNNVVIGGSTAAAGTFTTLTANGLFTPTGGISTSTIDNMVIGGTTAAAGTFTTLNASSTSYLSHLVPSINNAYDLGSPSSSWRNINASGTLFVGSTGTSTISGGLSASVLNVISSSVTSTFANGIQLNGGCFRLADGTCAGAGSGANTALSNLASVAINTSLLSDANNTDDLGSYLLSWRDIYTSGTIRLGNLFSQRAYIDATSSFYSATATIRTNPTDNIGNVGLIFDTQSAISNSGAKLLSIREGGTELSFFDSAGGLQTPSSTVTGTFSAAGSGIFYGALTLGDGGDDISINSNDWDISSAGVATSLSLSTSTLDSVTIGGTTGAAGTFTTLNASSTSYLSHTVPGINNAYDLGSPSSSWRNINASGTLFVGSTGTSTFSGGLSASVLNIISSSVTSTFANGIQLNAGCFLMPDGTCAGAGSSGANTALSNLSGVAINTSLLSDTNNTDDLGSYALSWKNIYASGTVFAKGFSTSTLDNVIIGGSTRAAGNFTTFDFNGAGTLGDGGDDIAINSNDWDISSAGTATGLSLSTSTIDNMVIGGTTASAGTFTTLNASSTSYLSHLVPSINNAYDLGSPSSSWRNINASGTLFIAGSGTSTISGGLQASVLNVTSNSATSTFGNGIQLNNGCFRDVVGNCLTVAGGSALTALSNLASVAINTSLLSDTNNTDDLGGSGFAWRSIFASGTSYLGHTVSGGNNSYDLGSATSSWKNIYASGTVFAKGFSTSTLDNVVIGGSTRAAGNFTAFDFNGVGTIGDGGDAITVNSNTWDISSAGTATGFSLSTSTIDNITIGGTTGAAGTFTTLNASSTSYLSHLVPSINNAFDLGSPSSSWRNINASGTLFIGSTGTSTISGGLSASVLNLTSNSVTSTFANGIQLNGGCFRDIGGSCIVAGANTALSNLASVAINTSLLSDTNNTDDLGSYALSWKNIYASGTIFAAGFSTSTLNNVVIGGSTAAAGTFTTLTANGLFTPTGGISTSTIDNIVIGGTTGAAGRFTTLNASSTSYLSHLVPSINNAYDLGSPSSSWRNINASGTLFVGSTGTSTFSGGLQASVLNLTSNSVTSTFANGIQLNGGCFRDIGGTCIVAGATTALSNLASVAINTSLLSDANNTDDLGSYALSWRNIYASGTVFAKGFSTSTLDNMVIGGSTAAAGTFTTLTISSTGAFNGVVTLGDGGDDISINSNDWDISSAGTATSLSISTSTIDNITIGGTTGAAGTFTTLNASSTSYLSHLVPSINNAYDLGSPSSSWRNINASGTLFVGSTGTSTFSGGLQASVLNVISSSVTSTFANGIQLNGGCYRLPDGTCVGASSGANVTLSNLTAGSVAINTSLISDTANTDDLGSSLIPWKDIYASGTLKIGTANNGSTSTFYNGLQVALLNVTSSTVTSTFANGLQLNAGCFRSASGNCLTSVGEGWTDSGNLMRLTTNTDVLTIGQSAILAGGPQVGIVATSTTAIPFIVQGAAEQSAVLSRWQNSAGTPLAWIDSVGGIQAASGTITGTFTVSGAGTSTVITGNAKIDGNLSVGGSATATFANGINVTTGCFAVNGTCVGGGGGGVDGVTVNTYIQGSATWSKPAGIIYAEVIVTGGGGGGGAVTGDGTNEGGGGGGGAGGTTIEMIAAANLLATEDLVVGGGGAGGITTQSGSNGASSTFGTTPILSAGFGFGGGGVNSTTACGAGDVGLAGRGAASSTDGQINISGGEGGTPGCVTEGVLGGHGGASYWGGGGNGGTANGAERMVGATSTVRGAGGGGAANVDSAGSSQGGSGNGGIVVVFSYTSSAGDLAEWYETKEGVEAGDVVAVSRDFVEYDSRLGLERTAILEKATSESKVVGVVSSAPFETIGGDVLGSAKHPKPIALAGRVPVKVSEENGKITAGDMLTVSSVPGVAMRSTKAGVTIGRTLEDADCEDDQECRVMILVNTSYSTGRLIKEMMREDGVDLDAIPADLDVGRIILAEMLEKREDITASSTLSEVFTDRVVAGLEIIAPRVVTDTLVVNSIEPVESDITFNLLENGKFVIPFFASSTPGSATSTEYGTASSTPGIAISFDAFGNGFFAGEVRADKITANQIQGLEIITDRLTYLSDEVNSSSTYKSDLGADSFAVDGLARFNGLATFASSTNFLGDASFNAGVTIGGELRAVGAIFDGAVSINKLSVNDFDSAEFNEVRVGLGAATSTLAMLEQSFGTLSSTVASSTEAIGSLDERVAALEGVGEVKLADLLGDGGALQVGGITTLAGGLKVDSIGSIGTELAFMNDTVFFGRPYFTTDTAGFALIYKGQSKVEVVFEREYLEQPIVNITLTVDKNDELDRTDLTDEERLALEAAEEDIIQNLFTSGIQHLVTRKSAKGFTILLNKLAPVDIKFSWIALAVKGAKTFSLKEEIPTSNSELPTSNVDGGGGAPIVNIDGGATGEPVDGGSSASSTEQTVLDTSGTEPTATSTEVTSDMGQVTSEDSTDASATSTEPIADSTTALSDTNAIEPAPEPATADIAVEDTQTPVPNVVEGSASGTLP